MSGIVRTYIFLLVGALCPFPLDAGQTGGDSASQQAHSRREVLSNLTFSGLPGESVAETALRFVASRLTQESPLEGRGEYVVDDVQSVPGGTHVRLSQRSGPYRIYGHEVIVSLNSSNEVSMVLGTTRSSFSSGTLLTSLSAEEALVRAKIHLALRGEVIQEVIEPEPYLFRDEEGADHLAYRILIICSDPMGDWEVLIDAATGHPLLTRDRFARQHFVQGRGYAYLPDPVSSAKATYGVNGFADNDDRNSDELAAQRRLVPLDSVRYESGVYTLRGPYCTIADVEAPHYPEQYNATSPDGFSYDRSEPGFEAVNAFYHVSESYRYLESLGFVIPSLRQIRIDPHAYNGEDNSHYSPTGNWIGFGEGGVDDAEDAEVIWHEYGHAIQYRIVPSWGGGEAAALGEGFGDYWAASYSRSLGNWSARDPEYDWLFKWDGHNTFWAGRSLDDPGVYPFDTMTSHEAGQIWATALMKIWRELGKTITDRLVIKSQFYLGYGTTAREAALAILQADRDLYNGIHIPVLAHWLGTIKRFIDPVNEMPVIAHDPVSIDPEHAAPLTITAVVSAGRGIPDNGVILCWQKAGETPDTTVMVPTTGSREYTAQIPYFADGAPVHYYISASDISGITTTLPYGAPDSLFTVQAGSVDNQAGIPVGFTLSQNYPNPFNPSTTMEFSVPFDGSIALKIYNMLGQEIATLVDGTASAGTHSVRWDGITASGSRAPSGTYLYRLTAVSAGTGKVRSETRKMILMK